MAKPIRPQEVVAKKGESLPDAVFEAFNELIVQNYAEGQATIKQADVVALMLAKGLTRPDIQAKGYLDVEPLYRAAGWKVEYDAPGYNETYPATYTFKRPHQGVELGVTPAFVTPADIEEVQLIKRRVRKAERS